MAGDATRPASSAERSEKSCRLQMQGSRWIPLDPPRLLRAHERGPLKQFLHVFAYCGFAV